jgi:hypothetical protein
LSGFDVETIAFQDGQQWFNLPAPTVPWNPLERLFEGHDRMGGESAPTHRSVSIRRLHFLGFNRLEGYRRWGIAAVEPLGSFTRDCNEAHCHPGCALGTAFAVVGRHGEPISALAGLFTQIVQQRLGGLSNGTVSASSNEDMVTSVWNSPPLLVNVCFSLTEMGHLAGASRIQTTTALYC